MKTDEIEFVTCREMQSVFSTLDPKRVRKRGKVGDRRPTSIWLARTASEIEGLSELPLSPRADRRLLLFRAPGPRLLPILVRAFRTIVVALKGHFLAPKQMAEVFECPDARDLLIGAVPIPDREILALYRGDLSVILVPYASVSAGPRSPVPIFDRAKPIDGGQTLRLGEYEASVDALLYEFDASYRKRARKRSLDADSSFGGSLRRLRLQKGLSRGSFAGLSSRTIARLERGEVHRPHEATLGKIARALEVEPDEISTY